MTGRPEPLPPVIQVVCANCRRRPRPDENYEDDWRVASDGVGELHTFCPECWTREFGPVAPPR